MKQWAADATVVSDESVTKTRFVRFVREKTQDEGDEGRRELELDRPEQKLVKQSVVTKRRIDQLQAWKITKKKKKIN